MLEQLLGELNKDFPELSRVVVSERDFASSVKQNVFNVICAKKIYPVSNSVPEFTYEFSPRILSMIFLINFFQEVRVTQ